MNNKTKIIFSGGGTLGSVTPLLGIYQDLKKTGLGENNFLWVGTNDGPEKKLVKSYGLKFFEINSGKLRRYFSWQNLADILKIILGFFESISIIIKFKPDIIISAGSFVSVPLVWAAKFIGKKIIIHQQDIRPGLANKIMAPAADKITVTFEKSIKDFNKAKVIWTGNPIRNEFDNLKELKSKAYNFFDLKSDKPILLILGGGTGASGLNKIIRDNLNELLNYVQIIHLTGSGKILDLPGDLKGYRAYEFLKDELFFAYAIVDLVISRAGLSTLTELSYLGKSSIIVPIPNSHQADNAKHFAEKEAVINLNQNKLTSEELLKIIKDLAENKKKREKLGNNFKEAMKTGANKNFIKIINSFII